jgi:hypothetical protein
MKPSLADAISGASLGTFLGLIIGMTTSPVAAAVIGTVTALATSFIGLGDKLLPTTTAPSLTRLTLFSLFAAGSLLAGVYIRTHDVLAPTPKQLMARLIAAQFTNSEALDIVRFTKFGLVSTGMTVAPSESLPVRQLQPTLFSTPADFCTQVNRQIGADQTSRLNAMLGAGEPFKGVAIRIQAAPADQRAPLLDAANFYLCGIR